MRSIINNLEVGIIDMVNSIGLLTQNHFNMYTINIQCFAVSDLGTA